MFRAILAICLLLFVGGLAYYVGRSSVEQAAPRPTVDSQMPRPETPPDQSRARTTSTPELSTPPVVAPNPDMKGPALPHTAEGQAPGDAAPLHAKELGLPLANLKPADIHDTYLQARGGGERRHEATDIMAPKGTPVVAVDTGIVVKLFTSKPGGLTVYQFDPSQKYAYYYAHLDRYAEGLREGMLVKKGDRVGYVGVTGNSDPNAPHLHFAIFELGPEKHWWEGKPVNPYSLLMQAVGR